MANTNEPVTKQKLRQRFADEETNAIFDLDSRSEADLLVAYGGCPGCQGPMRTYFAAWLSATSEVRAETGALCNCTAQSNNN